jgi:hypothetical protein
MANRLLLTRWQTVNLFAGPVAIFVAGLLILSVEWEEGPRLGWVFLIGGIGWGYQLIRLLHFKRLHPPLPADQIEQALRAAQITREWEPLPSDSQQWAFIRSKGWTPVLITVKATPEGIIACALPDPDSRSTLKLRGLKKDLDILRYCLRQAGKGIDPTPEAQALQQQQEAAFWAENEWSLVNLLKRLVGYILSLGFIGLMIWINIEKPGLKSFLVALPVWAIVLQYLVADIRVLFAKRKRRQHE